MELHQLKYVASVARHRSVAKASDELYVSRQAISKAIRSLEQEIGFEIFDRENKMRPTKEGSEIIRHANKVIQEVTEIDLYADSKKNESTTRDTLSIAFTCFPLDFLFFNEEHEAISILKEFSMRTPDCNITTHKQTDAAILRAVQDGIVDIGFVHGNYEVLDLKVVPVATVEMRVITHKTAPLAQKSLIKISDLNGVPIRSPLDFDMFCNSLIARCKKQGFEPHYQEVPLNDESILTFCMNGGVHIQPYDPSMEVKYPDQVYIPFHPKDRDELPLCLIYNEHTNPLATKFVRFYLNTMTTH